MKILCGSQNFGYNLPDSDKDWIEYTYPSWENIINNTITKEELVDKTTGSHTKHLDIRTIHNIILHPNISILQFMYSTEYIDCEDLKLFIENRDKIVKANKYRLYKSNSAKVINELVHDKSRNTLVRAYVYRDILRQVVDGKEVNFMVPDSLDFRLWEMEQSISVKRLKANEIIKDIELMQPYFELYNNKIDNSIQELIDKELIRLIKLRV